MISFYSILLSLSVVAGVFASPHGLILQRNGTSNETGYIGDYYYTFYIEGVSDVTYNPSNGSYTVDWDDTSDYFLAGIG